MSAAVSAEAGFAAPVHDRPQHPAPAAHAGCGADHSFAEPPRESPPPAHRGPRWRGPDRSADASAIADNQYATPPTAGTSEPSRNRHDVAQSRRISPRLLREIRRRFFYNLQIKLGIGQFSPQPMIFRLQLRRRALDRRRSGTRCQFPIALESHPIAQTRSRNSQSLRRLVEANRLRQPQSLQPELVRVLPIRCRFLSHLPLRSSEHYQNPDVRRNRAGSVLFVGGSETSVPKHQQKDFRAALWDPHNGTFKILITPTDVFCT